ncbi:hypothetical protein WDU94_006814 [Cyamophila willieti]
MVLNFLQDVSDRIEKEELTDSVVLNLERGAHIVTRGDWRSCIDPEVASDLRKYRSYRGESCRDLLRALRNKKHHYRELSPEAQRLLGSVPNEFVTYWLSKYPALVQHTWVSMQCIRHEPCLAKYYTQKNCFDFVKKGDLSTPKWIEDYVATTPNKKSPPTPNSSPLPSHSTGGSPDAGGSVVDKIFNKPTASSATKTNNKYTHWKNKKAKQQLQQQLQAGATAPSSVPNGGNEVDRVVGFEVNGDIIDPHRGNIDPSQR